MRLKYPYSTQNTWGSIWENNENYWIFQHFYTKKAIKDIKIINSNTCTLKKAIKDIKIIHFWLKQDILPKITYKTTDLWKKTIFEKITLPSQNLRYLRLGKSVFRLIAKGRDTFINSTICLTFYKLGPKSF